MQKSQKSLGTGTDGKAGQIRSPCPARAQSGHAVRELSNHTIIPQTACRTRTSAEALALPSHTAPCSYLNVRDVVQVERAENVEDLVALVVLGEARCVYHSFHLMEDLAKRAFK